MQNQNLIGPFTQLLTMTGLPERGPLADEQLEIIFRAGIIVQDGKVREVGDFEMLRKHHPEVPVEFQEQDLVVMPGWIDAHTHICFAGDRAIDYAARNNGKTYLEIARAGGGIWSTVLATRQATPEDLLRDTLQRLDQHLQAGITTVEIKSGYGLSLNAELKMLRVIREAGEKHPADVIATCLAAHTLPREYPSREAYLQDILTKLVPIIQQERLCQRFDIFVEESAFSGDEALTYLSTLKDRGFALTVHGDQFTPGGSQVAIDCGAVSADHLEVSGDKEIAALAASQVTPVALPGASIGLGAGFTPARKLLNAGCPLVIASDWNPGSAPQGDLLCQAAILGAYEKLSAAETFAALTVRAASVLGFTDRGQLAPHYLADMVAFPTTDYRQILYQQGRLKASAVWKKGIRIK